MELLKTIFVYTNSQLFRKYVLTHDVDPQLGYERVTQLQEFNANNEAANPVIFEYSTTTMDNANSETVTSYTNNLNFNDVELSGDFDGDGRLDFVTENGLYRNLFNGSSGQAPVILPNEITQIRKNAKLISNVLTDGKLNQFSSLITAKENANSIEFKVFNFNLNTFSEVFTKNIGSMLNIVGS